MHVLKQKTFIPISLEKAWNFFSNPENLKVITPNHMGFNVTSEQILKGMYEGMIITYTVTPLLGISMNWMTEITHIKNQSFFVDEQRVGPYKVWHHQHHFKAVDGGVEMWDIVDYVLPLGFLGRILEPIMVRPKLKEIFDFREAKIKELFG